MAQRTEEYSHVLLPASVRILPFQQGAGIVFPAMILTVAAELWISWHRP
jgi:hypothetical protein